VIHAEYVFAHKRLVVFVVIMRVRMVVHQVIVVYYSGVCIVSHFTGFIL
jgi:hypothetical protein